MQGELENDSSLRGSGAMPLDADDPRRIGAFRLLGVLGSGGMGRVYLGAVPGTYAAVKRVLPALELLHRELLRLDEQDFEDVEPSERGILLAGLIGKIRPELCVYLVTDVSVEEIAGRVPANCLRVFYQQEDFFELHLNILRGVNMRYQTPFFTALREYSRQPTGVFHAMPISRGKSVTASAPDPCGPKSSGGSCFP